MGLQAGSRELSACRTVREDLVGVDARRMVVDRGGDDQLVRHGLGDDRFEAFSHGVRRSDVRAAQHVRDVGLLGGRPVRLDVVDGRRELTPAAADDIRERLLRRREQPLSRRVVVRCDDVHGDHHVGLLELRRGLEARAVHLERRQQQIGREVRGERIREAERRRQLRAVEARAEDPERHMRPDAGNREHRLSREWIAEQRLELQHVLRERVGASDPVAGRAA